MPHKSGIAVAIQDYHIPRLHMNQALYNSRLETLVVYWIYKQYTDLKTLIYIRIDIRNRLW